MGIWLRCRACCHQGSAGNERGAAAADDDSWGQQPVCQAMQAPDKPNQQLHRANTINREEDAGMVLKHQVLNSIATWDI